VFIFRQAHKARVQTGDGFELAIKRANPKLYSSSYVEIFGTLQVRLQTKKTKIFTTFYSLISASWKCVPESSIFELNENEFLY
jgi:hypothetical protein